MRASLTFSVFTSLLIGLAEITHLRMLLGIDADDRRATLLACIPLVIVASALTIWTLQLQRGWSPE